MAGIVLMSRECLLRTVKRKAKTSRVGCCPVCGSREAPEASPLGKKFMCGTVVKSFVKSRY